MSIAFKDLIVGKRYDCLYSGTCTVLQIAPDFSYVVAKTGTSGPFIISNRDYFLRQNKVVTTYEKALSFHPTFPRGGDRYSGCDSNAYSRDSIKMILLKITEEDGVPVSVELVDKKGFN